MPHTEPQYSLRQLVRAFTDGQIDRHTYRSRRALLLDELAAKSCPQPSQPIQANTCRAARNPHTASAPPKPPIVLIVTIAIIALLITVLGFRLVMSTKDQPGKKENALPQQQDRTISYAIPPFFTPVQPTTTIFQNTHLEEGIKAFVKNNTWDDASRRRLSVANYNFSCENKCLINLAPDSGLPYSTFPMRVL